MKKMWYVLFEESSTRKPYWIFHGDEFRAKMKRLIFKDRKPLIDDVCLKRFEEDYMYDLNDQYSFIKDLKNNKIFDKIIDIINSDENFKNVTYFCGGYDSDDDFCYNTVTNSRMKKEIISEKIERSFKNVYSV